MEDKHMSIATLVHVLIVLLLCVSMVTLWSIPAKVTNHSPAQSSAFTVSKYCLLVVIFLNGMIFCAHQFNIQPLIRILDISIY